jgi:hypothetical protein
MTAPEEESAHERLTRVERANVGRMIFDAALALAVLVIGIWVNSATNESRETAKALAELRAEAATIRERLPIDYVRSSAYERDIGEIRRLLEKLNDKMPQSQRGQSIGPGIYRDGRDINR